jgi:hypothetical protein
MFFHGESRHGVYDKSSTGALQLAPANADVDRGVLIEVTVRETFANGNGAQPTFKIGQTSTTNKFADTSAFTGLAEGSKRTFGGVLSATKDLVVTATAGTGTATGAITVRVVIIPQSA